MINITKLTQVQKMNTTGGSFYALALGIGILVSTISGLITNAISMTRPVAQATNYGFRRTTIMRLSPVPSRSSISIFG
ncbi:MAG: hypothetical protein ACOQNY_02295 [Mycoplasmoidaceae bacterium]